MPTPAPEPPDCCAAWSCSAKALLVAGSPPVGLRRAAWNAGVGAIDANASEILVPACEKRIDRKTAVPSVPPIWRVKVADEVATPMSRRSTAFCTARVSGWKLKPRPMPKKNMTIIVFHSGVSAPT